jgi:hypothetical protein
MISFRWETVRTYGDAEPAQLEEAIRQVLANQAGTWEVTVGRSARAWRLNFKQRLNHFGPGTRITTTIPMPLAEPTALKTTLAESLSLA